MLIKNASIGLTLPLSIALIGFFSSFFSGLLMIRFAMYILERVQLKPFGWYCLAFATLIVFIRVF